MKVQSNKKSKQLSSKKEPIGLTKRRPKMYLAKEYKTNWNDVKKRQHIQFSKKTPLFYQNSKHFSYTQKYFVSLFFLT